MVRIAVAGGTGDVGRTFVDEILKTGRHQVFVLTRKTPAQPVKGIKYLETDYSVSQLRTLLRDNNVEIVLSTLLTLDQEVAKLQVNLVRGAAQSTTVNRFIPTEFFVDHAVPLDGGRGEMYLERFQKQTTQELDRHPQLTYTLIRNGLFLDYIGMPYMPTNIKWLYAFFDMTLELCIFPEDGSQEIVFTHSTDVGKYIEGLICLPASKWPREAYVEGNRIQLKDLKTIMKKISGRDFTVINESVEAIRNHKWTRLPYTPLMVQTAPPHLIPLYRVLEQEIFFTVLADAFQLPGKNLDTLVPGIKPIKIEDFLREAWEAKEEIQEGHPYYPQCMITEGSNPRL